MKIFIILFFVGFFLSSCSFEEIRSGKELSINEIRYIENLGILDENEQIIYFSSNYTFKKSGNFYTDKRVASYWLIGDKEDDFIKSAWYSEIEDVHINYGDGFDVSYIKIQLKNGKAFNIYFNGEKEELDLIYYDIDKAIRRYSD